MKNQYNYQYQSARTNLAYTGRKKQENVRVKKYKLLIIILKSAVYRSLKQCFSELLKYTNQFTIKVKRIIHISELNHNSLIRLAYQGLKRHTVRQRLKQCILKKISKIQNYKQKSLLKQSFGRILVLSLKKMNKISNILQQNRKLLFINQLSSIFKRIKYKKLVYFIDSLLKKNSRQIKAKFIVTIIKNHLNKRWNFSLNKIIKYGRISSFNKVNVNEKELSSQMKQTKRKNNWLLSKNDELEGLRLEIEDIKIQLQNKNDLIEKMKQQFLQLKNERIGNSSILQYHSTQLMINKSRSKSIKKFNLNDSYDSNYDLIIGSILGASFTTLSKSRSKSIKKVEQNIISDCNCGWKQKYFKYKNINESLKNQLQIVKQQLQLAKDLNDHFTNQIRQYFNGQKNQFQIDCLKRQFHLLQKERDQLKKKVIKYQNHITTLKSEFKNKIQDLYRKVKKER